MKIKIPLYAGSLKVIQVDDLRLYCEKENIEGNEDGGCSALVYDNNDTIFIVFEGKPSHGVVAHEAIHATNIILSYSGVIADFNNDEPQAYLLKWVVNTCYKNLKF